MLPEPVGRKKKILGTNKDGRWPDVFGLISKDVEVSRFVTRKKSQATIKSTTTDNDDDDNNSNNAAVVAKHCGNETAIIRQTIPTALDPYHQPGQRASAS